MKEHDTLEYMVSIKERWAYNDEIRFFIGEELYDTLTKSKVAPVNFKTSSYEEVDQLTIIKFIHERRKL